MKKRENVTASRIDKVKPLKKRDKGEKGFGNRSIRRDYWVLTGREEVEKVGGEGGGAVTVGGIKRG